VGAAGSHRANTGRAVEPPRTVEQVFVQGMQVDSPGSVVVAGVRQGVLCNSSSLDAMRHSGTDTRRQMLDGGCQGNQPHSKRPLERLHSTKFAEAETGVL
jgi:hypothetical protein